MKIWVDAHLSQAIAAWMNRAFTGVEVQSIRSLGLRDAKDREVFFLRRVKWMPS